jgi:hypothetical protein
MRKTKVVLCVAPHCAIRRRHRPGCQHAECSPPCQDACCWGCLPRTAAEGVFLCGPCTRRIGEDARRCAEMHVALDDRIIPAGIGSGSSGGGGGGGSSSPAVPDDDVLDARGRISAVLVAIARIIVHMRGVSGPVDQRSAPELTPHPDKGTSWSDPASLTVHRNGDPRVTAEFIAGHATWIAARQHGAASVCRELRTLATDWQLRALAYPAGSVRLYVGDCPMEVEEIDGSVGICGARLYQYPDRPLITCVGCRREETIEQWRRWLVGETDTVGDALAIASHLALMWMRPVDAGAVKKWAQRGRITPITVVVGEDEPADLVETVTVEVDGKPVEQTVRRRVVRDERNRTQYQIGDAVEHATKLWGPPAPVSTRAAQ